MKKVFSLFVALSLIFSIQLSLPSAASAAKTGSSCKKLNSKSWDGEKPIVCKKNKSGKLVWTSFATKSNVPSTYEISVELMELNETFRSSDSRAIWFCNMGGKTYEDVSETTRIEIRDGNGSILATTVLGSATVVDNTEGNLMLANCLFNPVLKVKKTDFYQIKIGKRYDSAYAFEDLVNVNWKISLTLG